MTGKNITPEEFMSMCRASLLKLGVYAVIVTDETTGMKGMAILENEWHPVPDGPEFIESLRHVKYGHKLDGIIGAEGYMKVEEVKMLRHNPKVLLVDSHEDPITQEIAKKYSSMGFHVDVVPASILSQAVKLKHVVAWVSYPLPLPSSKPYEEHASINPLTVDELLGNSFEHDGQVVYVFGMISELGHLEGPFFRLDGKLLVCYSYNKNNLQSQLDGVQNGDPMIVTGIFQYDEMTLYAENIRPSKVRQ